MKATTVKLDGATVSALAALKPAKVKLTTFVRQILEREISKRRLREAAAKYAAFLAEHRDETRWLEKWEAADLASPPKKGSR